MVIWRCVCIGIGILALLWFCVPLSLSVSLNLGNMTGIAVAAVLLLYGIFMPKVHKVLGVWRKHPKLKWCYRFLLGVIGLIVTLVVIESGCMIKAACNAPLRDSTAVVLGCRVYGERPSLSMIERLDAAYEYLVENEEAVAVLSGGQGSGENITEAECMYRYLVNKGVSAERLYKEEQSTDTRENLLFSARLIEEQGLHPQVAIATSEYHMYRAGMIADSLGMEHGAVPGRTAIWLFPTYYVRELYGILYEWIF